MANPWTEWISWRAFERAVRWLTILPLPHLRGSPSSLEPLGGALVWFPLVGAGIGVLSAWLALWVGWFWPQPVPAAFLLAIWTILTGGMHLDGFADMLDGLAAWKNPKETLRIMRDSHIGAVGAMGLVLLIILKWSFLMGMPPSHLIGSALAVGALSRLGMVLSAWWFPYVPGEEGLGRLATDRDGMGIWVPCAFIGIAVAVGGLGWWVAILCVGVMGLTILGIAKVALARLGGITGDVLGAINEWVELSLWATLSLVWKG